MSSNLSDKNADLYSSQDGLLEPSATRRFHGEKYRYARIISWSVMVAAGLFGTYVLTCFTPRLTETDLSGFARKDRRPVKCSDFSDPGTDCSNSGCCKDGGATGYQCYRKNGNWAQCLESCEPGVHPDEKEGSYDAAGKFHPAEWSCDEVGPRSTRDPCSAPGEDCRSTRCCSSARGGNGMTCYEKDSNWASCRESCDEVENGNWNCNPLGNRTRFQPNCGWAGQSCADNKLCCNIGFVCAVKDQFFTGCTQTVKKTTFKTHSIAIPWGWQGIVVGGGRVEYAVAPAKTGEDVAATKLYCFMAYLPGSYEDALYEEAKRTNSSVFACEFWDIFHSWKSPVVKWDSGESTLSNTNVFIKIWDIMLETGKYMQTDWTVKVDADAVLLPWRLKSHLSGLRPPAFRPMYIKNNKVDVRMGNNGFLGAVEVFSKQAVQIYADNKDGCYKSLGTNSGEDGYFKGCMDALGVGYMLDPELFTPDISAGACYLGQRAAFHPLKTPKDWRCCLDITNGISHNVAYGFCDMVYPPIGDERR